VREMQQADNGTVKRIPEDIARDMRELSIIQQFNHVAELTEKKLATMRELRDSLIYNTLGCVIHPICNTVIRREFVTKEFTEWLKKNGHTKEYEFLVKAGSLSQMKRLTFQLKRCYVLWERYCEELRKKNV
jgi:hypothetical protein